MNRSLTVCALTPSGRGAVATIQLAGSTAHGLIGRFLHHATGPSVAESTIGQIRLAAWGKPNGERIVVCRQEPDVFEIHCHGGMAAVDAIVQDLVDCGATRLDWPDIVTVEAADRISAQALVALSAARTERTAAILLDQSRGALRQELRAAQLALAQNDLSVAGVLLRGLAERGTIGLHLTAPFCVTLAGPPNVGKSSLINALVGYARSIVHNEPGTTRDVLTAQTAIDGWPVELSDTAGMRDSNDPLGQAGVERAQSAAQACDLVLLVRDASADVTASDLELQAAFPSALRVLNKCDLIEAQNLAMDQDVVQTSALSGAGLDELLAAIARRLAPATPAPGVGVPFTPKQLAAIECALAAIESSDAMLANAKLDALH